MLFYVKILFIANYFCGMFKRNAHTNNKIIGLSKFLLLIFFIVTIVFVYCSTFVEGGGLMLKVLTRVNVKGSMLNVLRGGNVKGLIVDNVKEIC